MCVCVFVYVSTCACMSVCMCVCMRVCVCMGVCMCVPMCMCMFMCLCMCVCVYTYMDLVETRGQPQAFLVTLTLCFEMRPLIGLGLTRPPGQ